MRSGNQSLQVVDNESSSSILRNMDENDKSPSLPFVNLMDINVEPTTFELEAMMKDVQARATRKWEKARAAYWDAINDEIRRCQ